MIKIKLKLLKFFWVYPICWHTWHTLLKSLARVRLKGCANLFFGWHTWHTFINIILRKIASKPTRARVCYGKEPAHGLRERVWQAGTLGTLFLKTMKKPVTTLDYRLFVKINIYDVEKMVK